MSFRIERNDITKVCADAIVNTANHKPVVGQGTDTVIYEAAGREKLLESRKKIGSIERGFSACTPAFDLKKNGVKYIIHTVGTFYEDGKNGETDILRSCYRTSLRLAVEKKCKSVAIPLLASGNYGFPKEIALQIADEEISRFLLEREIDVILVVYDDESYKISEKLFDEVENFLFDNLERFDRNEVFAERSAVQSEPIDVDSFINSSKEKLNFQNTLMQLIADRKVDNSAIYKKAFVDKKFFSKIISNKDYVPKKHTVMALGLALELPLAEYEKFLASAGYAFMLSSKFDLIIKFCVINHIFDLFKVDVILTDHGEQCFTQF